MKNIPITINITGLTDVEKEQLSTMFENTGRVLRGMLAMKGRDPDKLNITVTEAEATTEPGDTTEPGTETETSPIRPT